MLYSSSFLFWYKLIFLGEIILAEAMFLYKLNRRNYFLLRLIAGIGVCFAATYFYPIYYFNFIYTSLMFFFIFALTIVVQKLCFDETWITLLFCSLAAYSTQHIAYQIFSLTTNITGIGGEGGLGIYDEISFFNNNGYTWVVYACSYIITYWFVMFVYAEKIEKNSKIIIKNLSILLLVGICFLVNILINAIINYTSYQDYNLLYVSMAGLSSIIICLFALTLQFKLLLQKNLKEELDKAYHLLRQEKKQYEMSKANVDLINMKCHDLKHQIRAIGKSGSISERAISEIEGVINIYDSVVKTGNEALDIIITEKSLLCNNKNIKLTCVADGAKLDFIDEIDLYTLFGNAFDNAIEAVLELDPEKRVIGFTTKQKGNLFSVCLRNFYKEDIVFENGLPVTTKADKDYHGFGIKSIERILEKYGGHISIVTEKDVFILNMLFDLPTDSKELS